MKNNLWKMTDKQIIIVKRIQQCGGYYTPYGVKDIFKALSIKQKSVLKQSKKVRNKI